ncbi:MAG: thioredoxin [Chryseolinea sp.]
MAQTTFAELIQGNKPTFVDFSAEWCGPCKMMVPILEDLKSKIGDKARIIKIDIDKNPQAASAYRVQSVPTLMLFKNGNVMWRQSGVVPTESLKKVIDQYAEN